MKKVEEKTIDQLVEEIATGPHEAVTVHKDDMKEVLNKVQAKYWGTMTFFVFGSTAHITRTRKKPMQLRETEKTISI